MIISHRLRLIFLKTRKTAGTSLEIALGEHCGPDDIITPISPTDESARRELGFRGAQNHVVDGVEFRNHEPAARAKALVGDAVWRDYLKVTIERNPYDKALSRYWWSTRNDQPRPSVTTFLQRCRPELLSNWGIYTIDDAPAVDIVLRYEDLPAELLKLERRLGVGHLQMPRAKSGHRMDTRHYREVLSVGDRGLIDAVCSRELAEFGYAW